MYESKKTPQGVSVQEELVVKIPLHAVLIADLPSRHQFEGLLKEDPSLAIAWIENGFAEMPKDTFKVVIYEDGLSF